MLLPAQPHRHLLHPKHDILHHHALQLHRDCIIIQAGQQHHLPHQSLHMIDLHPALHQQILLDRFRLHILQIIVIQRNPGQRRLDLVYQVLQIPGLLLHIFLLRRLILLQFLLAAFQAVPEILRLRLLWIGQMPLPQKKRFAQHVQFPVTPDFSPAIKKQKQHSQRCYHTPSIEEKFRGIRPAKFAIASA